MTKDERTLRQRQAEIDAIMQRRGMLGGVEIRTLEAFSARIAALLTPPEPIEALDADIQRYIGTLRGLTWVANVLDAGVFPQYLPQRPANVGKSAAAQ